MGSRLTYLITGIMAICMTFVANAFAEPPGSGELAALYADVLKDPRDTKANMRYGRLAEVQGQLRLALSAYERVILNDPKNREAQAGFARVRRRLEPASTQIRVEVGTGVDTNPLNLHAGYETKPTFSAKMSLRDERVILANRWRTLVDASGEYPLDVGELLYGYAGVQTGPLLAVSPSLTIYPAVGGGVASLDQSLFYAEANGSLTFEGRFGGAFQAIRLRGGFRDYGSNFTADQGFFTDALARMTIPALFGGPGALQISPWARWSGIDGVVRNNLTGDRAPGRYAEWGLEVGYYLRPIPDLTLGTSVVARQRLFFVSEVNNERREDTYVAPGVSAVRSNVLSCACDVEIDYRYRVNNSNDSAADYHGHAATISFASHF